MTPESGADVNVREATAKDIPAVSAILTEAALWLHDAGIPLWSLDEVSPERVRKEMASHLYVLAEMDGEPAGTMRFQTEDPVTWPEAGDRESTYVHRLAVRRRFAGRNVSKALVDWAIARTRKLDRPYLRLDCESDRKRLRQVYEDLGFQHHSDRRVGPHHVARYEYRIG